MGRRLQARRHDFNLRVVGVVVPPGYRVLSARRVPRQRPSRAELAEMARKFLARHGAGFECVVDPDGQITERYTKAWGISRMDELPAFYSRTSGLPVSVRLDRPEEVAELARTQWEMGLLKALLVGVPVPEEAAIPAEQMEAAIEEAIEDAEATGIWGKALTPFLLARVSVLTEGKSLGANEALLLHNAAVAAQIARCLAGGTEAESLRR